MRFLAAVQFLTIIPVRRAFSSAEIGRSAGFFPVVGLLIGLILAALYYALSWLLPGMLVNALLIVSLIALNGALHLDGLIDTSDGMASHRTPEERLRIMKDSRIGGYGAVGAILFLLVDFISLNSIPRELLLFTLILMPVISRWSMVFALWAYPYARPAGLGTMFKQAVGWQQLLMATGVALLAAIVLFKLAGLVILILAWLITLAIAGYLKRMLNGLTGDTYGAINELIEVSVFILISLLAYKHWLWIGSTWW